MTDDQSALQRARARRSEGVMTDFDGQRLSLARRRARTPRTELARALGVSAAAVTQFERNRTRPTVPLVAAMALALNVPRTFFAHGTELPDVPASAVHFRALRSTPALSRDQALAFVQLALSVIDALEHYIDFPANAIPTIPVDADPPSEQIRFVAAETRDVLGVSRGPVGHLVRTLEAAGVVVLTMPAEPVMDRRVDAFSTDAGNRPLVLLNPDKDDKARSRFDAAHELGHLVMHPDIEPGSRLVEQQAQTFASQFLAPDADLRPDLPNTLDWDALLRAKRKWGISLAALVYRCRRLELWSEATHLRAVKRLAADGYPERGPLGPRETPVMLGRAAAMLHGVGYSLEALAADYRLPASAVHEIVDAGSGPDRTLTLH